MERGRELSSGGKFETARIQFEIARQMSPTDSTLYKQASDELDFHLPMREIERRLHVGDLAAAEQLLAELLTRYAGDVERRGQIEAMRQALTALRNALPLPGSVTVDGDAVLVGVRRILEDYRRRNRRYPIGYRELNTVLPPNRPPLEVFLVAHYEADGSGYLLVLRNRYEQKHTLTLRNTGLIK